MFYIHHLILFLLNIKCKQNFFNFEVPFFILIIYHGNKNKSFRTPHFSRKKFLYFAEYSINKNWLKYTYHIETNNTSIFFLEVSGFLYIYRTVYTWCLQNIMYMGCSVKMRFSIFARVYENNLPRSYINLYK